MTRNQVGHYARKICRVLNCAQNEAVMIEDIMRNDVLHTVALDWLSAREFNAAAGKAALLLAANRAEFEAYYAGTRAVFDEMQAAHSRTG